MARVACQVSAGYLSCIAGDAPSVTWSPALLAGMKPLIPCSCYMECKGVCHCAIFQSLPTCGFYSSASMVKCCLSCLLCLAGGSGGSGSGGHGQGKGAGPGGDANSGSLWWKILLAILAGLLAVAVISTKEPEHKREAAK